MSAWDGLAATLESARLHTSDHWAYAEILGYLDLIDDALGIREGWVLDLGCGIGRLTIPYLERYPKMRAFAVDASRRMLELLRAREDAQAGRIATLLAIGGRTIPETVGLDGGWSILMFQHVPNETMTNYLIQLANRLKPGARFLFQFVTDAEPGPLSYPRHEFVAADMVHRVGLTLVEKRTGLTEDCWCWMTVEMPR